MHPDLCFIVVVVAICGAGLVLTRPSGRTKPRKRSNNVKSDERQAPGDGAWSIRWPPLWRFLLGTRRRIHDGVLSCLPFRGSGLSRQLDDAIHGPLSLIVVAHRIVLEVYKNAISTTTFHGRKRRWWVLPHDDSSRDSGSARVQRKQYIHWVGPSTCWLSSITRGGSKKCSIKCTLMLSQMAVEVKVVLPVRSLASSAP
jgi:hypothetical protein